MSYIETSQVKNSTIIFLYSERNVIKLDPPYQRMGGVWTQEKRQLLIDSILNDYDLPKIYFHQYSRGIKSETGITYAVIDGRQRLETIWDFIDGKFNISEDFEYQRDPSINLAGLSYDDLGKEYPRIKIQFDSFVLPVISVDTDDEDLIEDMFSRLNEAVPLNSAEKRNAIGGDMVEAIREIADHQFFAKKVKFNNTRYQYREASARFLLIEESILYGGKKLIDTKKVYLDAMARSYRSNKREEVVKIKKNCATVLSSMCSVFSDNDEILRAQGNMVVYYLLFRLAIQDKEIKKITRRKFLDFLEKLRQNREVAAKDFEKATFHLLDYDYHTRQGTNDATSIKARLAVLCDEFGVTYRDY